MGVSWLASGGPGVGGRSKLVRVREDLLSSPGLSEQVSVSRACHMPVLTPVDSGGVAWTIDTGQSLCGGSMWTYLVVSQHTCKRAVNGSIPLGGSTAPILLLGIGVFSARASVDQLPGLEYATPIGVRYPRVRSRITRFGRIDARCSKPRPACQVSISVMGVNLGIGIGWLPMLSALAGDVVGSGSRVRRRRAS